MEQEQNILDNKYIVTDTLGIGYYSKVKLASDLSTGKTYAVKIIREPSNISELNAMQKEAEVLIKLRNTSNIIQLKDLQGKGRYIKKGVKTKYVSYFLFELAECGELFKFLCYAPAFPEALARTFFQQIIAAVEMAHQLGIAHRDLKAENILLDKSFSIKLADFGSAENMASNLKDSIQNFGSYEYNAPEVLSMLDSNDLYTYDMQRADIFSLAVVLFVMILGCPPWQSARENDPYFTQFLCDKDRFWRIYKNKRVTPEFKDLFEGMANVDIQNRFTIEFIKQHPWFNGQVLNQMEVQSEMEYRLKLINSQEQESKVKLTRGNFLFRKKLQKKEKKEAIIRVSGIKGQSLKYNQLVWRETEN